MMFPNKNISCHCKIGVDHDIIRHHREASGHYCSTHCHSLQKTNQNSLVPSQGPGRCRLTSAAAQTTLEVRDSRKALRTSVFYTQGLSWGFLRISYISMVENQEEGKLFFKNL